MIRPLRLRQSLQAMLIGLLATSAQQLAAQSTVTLKGNTQNTYNQNYSSNGSLTINLGLAAEYLVVGGGGGGGGASSGEAGGGGGGGGAVLSGNSTLSATSHSVVVGAGGTGGINSGNFTLRQGANGGNSSFAGLSALGGGAGGAGGSGGGYPGSVGASGGGGGGRSSALGANGTTGLGNKGGNAGSSTNSNYYGGGGGGGAGGAGGNGGGSAGLFSTATGGSGGSGLAATISGSSVTYGGGGGGGAENNAGGGENGGSGNGGGGSGSSGSGNNGSSGAASRGGGGGGAGRSASGGAGGSGTVIVRYLGNQTATGGTVTTGTGSAAGYTIHTFTSTDSSSLDIAGLNLQATINGNITGTGDFNFNGPGTLKVGGYVNTGDIFIGTNSTLSVCPNGYLGALDSTVQTYNYKTGNLLGTVVFGNNISNNGTLVLNVSGALANRITGDITGSGGVTIGCSVASAPGMVVLAGNTSYSGLTTVNGGILVVEGASKVKYGLRVYGDADVVLQGHLAAQDGGIICGSGGTINLNGNNLSIDRSSADLPTASSINGTIAGTGTIAVGNGTTLTLGGTNGTQFLGDLVVGTNSTLQLASSTAINDGTVIKLDGGNLQVSGDTVVGYVENNGGTVTGGNLTNALTLVESGSVTTTITDGVNYDAGILKRTGSTATIDASQDFTGVVKVQEGTLAIGSNGSLDSSSSLQTYTGATMDLNDKSQTFSAVNGGGGTIDLGTGTLTVNSSTSNSSYGGSIVGTGGVVKEGSETLTLTGTNTYSGNTTVTSGTFLVDGSVNNSNVIVQSGATFGGSGSVGGLILQSGGTMDASGSMNVVGNATFAAGGNYDWSTTTANTDSSTQTAAGAAWDLLDVGGTLTFTGAGPGAFNLNLISLTGGTEAGVPANWDPNVGSTWLIASANSGIFFNSTLVTANTNYTSFFNIDTTGWTATLPNQGFRVITLDNTTNLYLQATAAVPEPGQVAASLLLLAGIGGYVWRKRHGKAKMAQPVI